MNEKGKRTGRTGSPALSVMIACAVALLVSLVIVPGADKAYGAGNLTDESFFGVWNGSSWTTAGKLNYGYGGGALAAVEAEAKAGDYAGAKTELLHYYQSRTAPVTTPLHLRDLIQADLAADNILIGQTTDYYMDEVTVTNSYQTVTADVLKGASQSIGTTKNLSVLLMGRNKEDSIAEFYSREQSANKPTLEIVIGGATYTLTADKDAYIAANTASNYGTASTLLVRDRGMPIDSNDRRAYINFDLSGLPSSPEPTSATLKLYGRNQSLTGDKDIIVFYTGYSGWSETSINWPGVKGNIYSWQGSAAGTDWGSPPYPDGEYVYTITRFPFAYYLAMEYQQTANTVYSDRMIGFMTDFAADRSAGYPRSLDTAIRQTAWVNAYHAVKNSPSLDADSNAEILKFVWQEASMLADPANYHPGNNWGVIESSGLYMDAVYFPEFAASAGWETTAKSRLDSLIASVNNADGSYTEATTDYARTVATQYNSIKNFGNANGKTFSAAFDAKLQAMAKYLMDSAFPNGFQPQYGDSDYIDAKPVIKAIGDAYSEPGLQYVGSDGQTGTAPPYTSTVYNVGKYAMMRTGWQDDDLYMHVNVNGNGSHAHPDLLSVIAYGYGRQLIVDPGRFSYDSTTVPNWLRMTTEAHSTIEIDNSPLVKTASGSIDKWVANGNFDFFKGTHNGYSGFAASRNIFFVKPDFWIVSDAIAAPAGTHRYEQNWQLLPGANPTIDAATKKTQTAFSDGANIQIVPADPSELTAALNDGYYSPSFLAVSDTTYPSYVKNVSGNVTFDTVLYPTAQGDNRNVAVSRLSTGVDKTVATALKIDYDAGGSGNLGYYYLSHEASPSAARSFGSYTYDGRTAYVEETASGSLVSASVVSGRTLKQGGTNLIAHTSAVNDLSVEWNGTTLDIYGSNLYDNSDSASAIAIYAPSAATVRHNGASVPFTRVGDYVYAVGTSAAPPSTPGTYAPVADSYVHKANPTTNYGTDATIESKQSANYPETARIAYVKFDFSDYGSSVAGAKLRFTTGNATGHTLGVYGLSNDGWTESGITWSNAPNNDTSGYGLTGTGVTNIGTVANGSAAAHEIDVTAFVQSQADKVATFAIVTNTLDDVNGDHISSREGSAAPLLVLTAGAAYDPSADSYVHKANPTTNYGTAASLQAKQSANYPETARIMYMKFDFTGHDGPIAGAKLRFTTENATGHVLNVYGLGNDGWTETGITWSNAPNNNTSGYGLTGTGVTNIGTVTNGSAAAYELNVTAFVQGQADKVATFAILANTLDDVNGDYVTSREGAAKPQLLLN